MYAIIEIYVLLAALSIQALTEKKNLPLNFEVKSKYVVLISILILYVGFRDKSLFADYANYEWIYRDDMRVVEPTFYWISFFSKNILHGSIKTVMFIYAFISIIMKWEAIKRYSSYPALSFMVLISDLFLLQECTQIRAAVATSFLLLSIEYIYERRLTFYFMLVICSTLFHASSLLMIPLYFINPKSLNKKFWFSLIILGYCLTIFRFNPMAFFAKFIGGYIGQKLIFYTSPKDNFSVNVFSIYSVSKLFLLLILLFRLNLVKQTNKYGILFIKIQALSIFSLCVFSQNLAAGLRISEFYSIADVLLFPLLVSVIKEKTYAKLILVLFCLFWLTMRIFRYKLILL